jgi:hypothetical protein
MKIADLNHLEVVEASVKGGIMDQSIIDSRVFFELVDINKYISGTANVSGNVAFAEADALAFGNNSLSNALTQTYTDESSSVSAATSASATGNSCYWGCY